MCKHSIQRWKSMNVENDLLSWWSFHVLAGEYVLFLDEWIKVKARGKFSKTRLGIAYEKQPKNQTSRCRLYGCNLQIAKLDMVCFLV